MRRLTLLCIGPQSALSAFLPSDTHTRTPSLTHPSAGKVKFDIMDNIRAGEDMDQREMQMALIYKINAAGREVSPAQPNTHAHTKECPYINAFACVQKQKR